MGIPAELGEWLASQGVTTGLLMARLLGLIWPVTSWGFMALGARERMLLAMFGAMLLLPVVGPEVSSVAATSPDPAALGLQALAEAARGMALGLGAALVMAAARQAGELIGLAAGLTPIIDAGPSAGLAVSMEAEDPLTPPGVLYVGLALVSFLALDGPLALVDGVVESYRTIPVGGSWPTVGEAAIAIGHALTLALRLAAPLVTPVVLAQVCVHLVTRLGSATPWSSLAWPLRQALAVVLLGLGVAWSVGVLRGAWASMLGGH